jgi:hypothetical protein
MPGKIRKAIDCIIEQRARGNGATAGTIRTKLILKGINPEGYDDRSDDDPVVMGRLAEIASQMNITMDRDEEYVRYFYSTKSAEREAVEDMKLSFMDFDARVLIFFASVRYDQKNLFSLISEAFPRSVVLGCSSAGEMFNGELLSGSVVAMALSPKVIYDVKVEVVRNIGEYPDLEPAFWSFGEYFRENPLAMDPERYAGLVLLGCQNGGEEVFMDLLGDMTDIRFAGGSAGDNLSHQRTYVHAEGGVYSDAAVLAIMRLNENFDFDIIKTQSFRPLDRVLVANRVNTAAREVLEFNGRPAMEEYASMVGAPSIEGAPRFFISNPLGLMIGRNDVMVRSPMKANGGAMDFYCRIEEGTELRLLESTDIIGDTRRALMDNIAERGPLECVINFNCVLRAMELRNRNLEPEFAGIFRGMVMAGFSTYGEEYIGHVNQTSIMLVFRRRRNLCINTRD